MGGGDTSVNYPGPSKEEKDLQREQLELLRMQRSETEAFKPILLEQYGITPTYDSSGKLTGYEYTTEQQTRRSKEMALQDLSLETMTKQLEKLNAGPTALEKAQEEVGLLQAERTKKALSGELPLSEGTVSRKQAEWDQFKESMARAGNPIFGDSPESSFSNTTAGNESLQAFNQAWKVAEDAERRGDISVGAQLVNESTSLASSLRGAAYGASSGFRSSGLSTTDLYQGVPELGTSKLLPSYLSALQPYQLQRQGEFQADATNATNAATRYAGLMNMTGAIAGGLGSAMLIRSSKKFKKNIKDMDERKALSSLRKMKVYTFDYKEEPTSKIGRHIGPVVEESPEEIVEPGGTHINLVNQIGLLSASLRALDSKLLKLEGLKKEAA
jgi:hypothetical protein